jgi:ribosomal-protein-alanine N-acetyltransferase
MFPLVPLSPQDGTILEKIHASCFPDGWDKGTFDRLLTENLTCGWMAQSLEGQPVGFILARALESEAEILTFAVRPSFQKLGIGRRLLKKLMTFLMSAGCKKVFLEVAVDNKAAIALYSSENFVKIGTRPNYYQRADGSFVTASLMAWTKIDETP